MRNSEKFSFDTFKNRNLELSKINFNSNPKLNPKSKSKKKQKEEGNENEDEKANEGIERQEFDQKLLVQLNKYIKEDSAVFTEQGKKINQDAQNNSGNKDEFKHESYNAEEENDNKFDGILVKRPPKGFVWGMGNQANKKKCKK